MYIDCGVFFSKDLSGEEQISDSYLGEIAEKVYGIK